MSLLCSRNHGPRDAFGGYATPSRGDTETHAHLMLIDSKRTM